MRDVRGLNNFLFDLNTTFGSFMTYFCMRFSWQGVEAGVATHPLQLGNVAHMLRGVGVPLPQGSLLP